MSMNMSLDEIIKANRVGKRGSKTTGRSSFGKTRGVSGGARAIAKSKIRGFGDNLEGKWKHDKFQEVNSPPTVRIGGGGNPNARVTISVSNLDQTRIQAHDLEDLFASTHEVESAVVHFDADGNSLGTGAVTCKRSVAKDLIQQYSNIKLDGRQLKLAIVGDNTSNGIQSRIKLASPLTGRISKAPRVAKKSNQELTLNRKSKFNKSFKAKKQGGGGFRHPLDRLESDEDEKPTGKGRGKGKGGKSQKTMEELDAEMDAYMQKK